MIGGGGGGGGREREREIKKGEHIVYTDVAIQQEILIVL